MLGSVLVVSVPTEIERQPVMESRLFWCQDMRRVESFRIWSRRDRDIVKTFVTKTLPRHRYQDKNEPKK